MRNCERIHPRKRYFAILMLFLMSLVPALAENAKVKDPDKKFKIWKSKKLPGFSVRYRDCWRPKQGDPSDFDLGSRVLYEPSKSCANDVQGKWAITISPPNNLSHLDVAMGPHQPPEGSFITTIMSDGVQTTVYQQKDSPDWFTEGKCGVFVGWLEFLDLASQKEKWNQHIVPPLFKEFIDGMKCKPFKESALKQK